MPKLRTIFRFASYAGWPGIGSPFVSLLPTLSDAYAPAAVRQSQKTTTIFLWFNAQRVTVLMGTPLLRRGQLDARPRRRRCRRPRECTSLVPRLYLSRCVRVTLVLLEMYRHTSARRMFKSISFYTATAS